MKYKTLIWIIVAVVAAVAVWWFFCRKDSSLDYGNTRPSATGNGSETQDDSNGDRVSSNDGSNRQPKPVVKEPRPVVKEPKPVSQITLEEKPIAGATSLSNNARIIGRS